MSAGVAGAAGGPMTDKMLPGPVTWIGSGAGSWSESVLPSVLLGCGDQGGNRGDATGELPRESVLLSVLQRGGAKGTFEAIWPAS